MRKFIGLTLIFATIFMAHPLLANTNDRIKAQFMVDLAINHYASATDKAVAFENISDPDGKFRDNDIYMFVFNPIDLVMHAHGANMDFIGKPQLDKVGDKMRAIGRHIKPTNNRNNYSSFQTAWRFSRKALTPSSASRLSILSTITPAA